MNKHDIMLAIDSLGIAGCNVCIHSSMRSFGQPIEGGASAVLDAFLESGCTVMVPAFSDMYEARPVPEFMPPQNGAGDYSYFLEQEYPDIAPYTPESCEITVEEMGAFFPLYLERTEEALRKHKIRTQLSGDEEQEVIANFLASKPVYESFEDFLADCWN